MTIRIAIPKEIRDGEKRVAASPETVKKFIKLGAEIVIETGAGLASGILDQTFIDAGATIAKTAAEAYKGADIILKVRRPMTIADGLDELKMIPAGAKLISTLNPYDTASEIKAYASAKIDAFAMELMPRITRAQSMDVLSSQSNLAGYRAVIDAAATFGRAYPMMMTAAGTVAPAKVLVMGAGVAGLQAIATAKRLGAVVSATDVRPAAKEQVESLGGSFVAVEDEEFKQAETAGGYAKQMSAEYQAKQAALIAETLPKMDIVICTALIPGRPAPVLITEDHVKTMKPGSVIVDLAAERGGNCPLSELGETVVKHNVTIIGSHNINSAVAMDSSQLYAKNLFNFLSPFMTEGKLDIDWEDELVTGILLTKSGAVVHERFQEAAAKAPALKAGAAAKATRAKSAASKTTAAKKPAVKKSTATKTTAAKAAPKKTSTASKTTAKAAPKAASPAQDAEKDNAAGTAADKKSAS